MKYINKLYDCFDDGKITRSRMYQVYVIRSLDITEIPKELKELVNKEIENTPHLYDPNPKEILEAVTYECTFPQIEYFLPTKGGGYFGLGEIIYDYDIKEYYCNSFFCSGRLDITGELRKISEERD